MRNPNIPYLLLCMLFLFGCKSTNTYLYNYDYERYEVDADDGIDQSIEEIIAPYKDELGETMDLIIGKNENRLPKQKPNSKLGNWFTDVLHQAAESVTKQPVDFALQNYGGLRIPALPEGDISVRTIYELMPFDNILIIIDADGPTTQKLLNRVAEYGGWPLSKGLSFSIHEGIAKDIMIGGKPFDIQKTYSIALPDYIANGGDDCEFLEDVDRNNTGIFLRDAVINELRKNDPEAFILVDGTKRITVE